MGRSRMISVVIAAHNAEDYIGQSIHSVLNQDCLDELEILVCDDASTDSTVEVVSRIAHADNRVKLITLSENSGAALARNRCISEAQGSYIAIQDADDVSEPCRIRKLVEVLENERDIHFVSSGYYLFDDSGRYEDRIPQIEYPHEKDYLYTLPFCHAATMFRAEVLKSAGGYRVSKETRRGQDYDLFMRLQALGFSGKNISSILYGYRVDSNTIARRKFKYRIDEMVIRYKGFKGMGLLPAAIPFVLKPVAAHLLQIARKK